MNAYIQTSCFESSMQSVSYRLSVNHNWTVSGPTSGALVQSYKKPI